MEFVPLVSFPPQRPSQVVCRFLWFHHFRQDRERRSLDPPGAAAAAATGAAAGGAGGQRRRRRRASDEAGAGAGRGVQMGVGTVWVEMNQDMDRRFFSLCFHLLGQAILFFDPHPKVFCRYAWRVEGN